MTDDGTKKQILDLLEGEWAYAEWLLQQVRELFRDQNRLDLLNCLSGQFMAMVWRLSWDNLLLRICRLTDPEDSGPHKNLTIRRVARFFDSEPAKRDELEIKVGAAVASAEFARDWRNRTIGHKDLSHALDREPRPLEQASLRQVDRALADVHQVLATIHRYPGVHFSRRVVGPDAVSALVGRTSMLVEAVQFVDRLIDRDSEEEATDRDPIDTFLQKLGHGGDSPATYGRLANLRAVAGFFPEGVSSRQL